MKEYKIVSDVGFDATTADVNKLLSEGWELVGGISTTMMYDQDGRPHLVYSQALVRQLAAG